MLARTHTCATTRSLSHGDTRSAGIARGGVWWRVWSLRGYACALRTWGGGSGGGGALLGDDGLDGGEFVGVGFREGIAPVVDEGGVEEATMGAVSGEPRALFRREATCIAVDPQLHGVERGSRRRRSAGGSA